MKVLLILAHPTPGSFNHAIAETVVTTATELGHTVTLRDLYQEPFDPCLRTAELARDAALPDSLAAAVDEVCTTDALVFVHPNYWSRPPAILCGWVDRVLRAGRAYNFVPDGQGGAKPVGLLKARVGMVFNTANTPQEKEEALFGDPLEVHWRKVVFGLCGVTNVFRRNFSPVIVSTPEQRAQWLAEVAEAVTANLPSAE
ncbi:MAG: NAD(P)H-dependent oxidoreductase [Verrucomicrobiales bacterium]|nr:NAD(P)H-dependent oxidoreductase [Verrucomicrobiales bacterium]MCP5519881.1 NAD(P)H-dependent oxidoreductase [Verrucomicrobiales bacterium]MCP5524906.1 NAD(P)H-dependent oxidoreductase [Verrucomicrobiales bacterium]